MAEPPVSETVEPGRLADSAESRTGWRRLSLAKAWPILVLIAIPTAVFGGSYLIGGHLLLYGDNLIQNYPLRVLVGQDLRHGVLPTWDPYMFGGTPLLAGLNAGVLYPLTGLFAVLSAGAAWVLGQILVACSIAVGTYVLLRVSGTSRLAGFLGAASFTFAGAVALQSAVHIDMAEGFASLPWALVAIRRLLDDGRWRWSLLLGASLLLLILAGSPEATLDVGLLCVAYALLRLTVTPGAWRRLVTRGGAAVAGAMGCSAIEWMPSLDFIARSQRAVVTEAFVSSYAYPPRALLLFLMPYVDGGSRLFSQPIYFGPSNLPEVAMYVGILPLVALGAMASRRWRRLLPAGEARTWLAVAALGLGLAVASETPLAHALIHVPFYGQQRNQGRNIVDVDFAACMLFAWWIDAAVGSRATGAKATPAEKVTLGFLLAVTMATGAALVASPSWLWRHLGDPAQPVSTTGSVGIAIFVAICLLLAAGVLVLSRPRLRARTWRGLVTTFVAVDLCVFAGGNVLVDSQAPPVAAKPSQLVKMISQSLTPTGRYAFYDPDLFYPRALVSTGETDLGILTGDASVEGYGAVENGVYAAATQTHLRASLSPTGLESGMFRQLDLEVVVASVEGFLTPVGAWPSSIAPARPLEQQPGTDPLLSGGNVPLAQDQLPPLRQSAPRPPVAVGGRLGWYFGETLKATAVQLALSHPAAHQLVKLGLVTGAGRLRWLGESRLGGSSLARFDLPGTPVEGLEIELLSGPPLGASQLSVAAGGRVFVDDGELAPAVTPEGFGYVGSSEGFSVFRVYQVPPALWAQPIAPGMSPAAGGRPTTVLKTLSSSGNSQTIEIVTASPALLTRSLAYDVGWHAEVLSGSLASISKAATRVVDGGGLGGRQALVRRVGLVQGVAVPAGASIVRFSYAAEGLSKGASVSALSLVLIVLCVAAAWVVRRRKRRRAAVSVGGPDGSAEQDAADKEPAREFAGSL